MNEILDVCLFVSVGRKSQKVVNRLSQNVKNKFASILKTVDYTLSGLIFLKNWGKVVSFFFVLLHPREEPKHHRTIPSAATSTKSSYIRRIVLSHFHP